MTSRDPPASAPASAPSSVPTEAAPWWRRVWRRPAQAAIPAAQPSMSPDASSMAGRQVAGYTLLRPLGRGASSEVHLALHAASGQLVALKLFALAPAASAAEADEARARFRAEAATAQRLRHPDIIAVLDAGDAPGCLWMAMEYVEGHDLTRYTQRQRLLPEPLVVQIGVRLARALAHAHALGVVHRDVKPENVRLDLPHDVVKLGDFGIARLAEAQRTRTGLVLGTPAYMAPELLAGGEATPAADVHALAVVLFELLAGQRPYRGDSLGELLRDVTQRPVPDVRTLAPQVPPALAQVLAWAMAKSPLERPAHARDFADALAAASGDMREGLPPLG